MDEGHSQYLCEPAAIEPLSISETIHGSLSVIDLGALEVVAVVDVDGLPCGVEVNGAVAFAMAVAGLFDAAEGQVNFCADGGGVHVGDAGFEVADGGEGAVDVACVERCGEAIVDAVGNLDGFFDGVEFDQGDHRAGKTFFAARFGYAGL